MLTKAGGHAARGFYVEGADGHKASLGEAALIETVRTYNAAVESNALDGLSPTRSTYRRAPQLIATAPFYAAPVCAGLTYTMGGVSINANAQVLDTSGTAIPGLYAAGACTGGRPFQTPCR